MDCAAGSRVARALAQYVAKVEHFCGPQSLSWQQQQNASPRSIRSTVRLGARPRGAARDRDATALRAPLVAARAR